jgi:hypothetical protein
MLFGICCIALGAAAPVTAQDPKPGSTDYLDFKNGFRDVKLGMRFTKIKRMERASPGNRRDRPKWGKWEFAKKKCEDRDSPFIRARLQGWDKSTRWVRRRKESKTLGGRDVVYVHYGYDKKTKKVDRIHVQVCWSSRWDPDKGKSVAPEDAPEKRFLSLQSALVELYGQPKCLDGKIVGRRNGGPASENFSVRINGTIVNPRENEALIRRFAINDGGGVFWITGPETWASRIWVGNVVALELNYHEKLHSNGDPNWRSVALRWSTAAKGRAKLAQAALVVDEQRRRVQQKERKEAEEHKMRPKKLDDDM